MKRYVHLLPILIILCCAGCHLQPSQSTADADKLCQELISFAKSHKLEFGVISLRQNLGKYDNKFLESLYLKMGGEQKDWDMFYAAAKEDEFYTGAQFGEKLIAKKILDFDVVEYLQNSLRNAHNSKRLAFSSGFISKFKAAEQDRALSHMETLWIWASPND